MPAPCPPLGPPGHARRLPSVATFRGLSDYPPPLNVFCIMPPHPYRAVGLRVIVLYCQLDAAQYDNATAAWTGRHTLFCSILQAQFFGAY